VTDDRKTIQRLSYYQLCSGHRLWQGQYKTAQSLSLPPVPLHHIILTRPLDLGHQAVYSSTSHTSTEGYTLGLKAERKGLVMITIITSCACGDTICLCTLQVDNIFSFIHQVAVLFRHNNIFAYLFDRWHLFWHVGYLRHQQQVDL